MSSIQIQLFRPDFGLAEHEATQRVLTSGWVGRGALTSDFERAFAAHIGVAAEHVLMLPSATDGLFHITSLLDLQANDEVILPSISFIGAAQAVASVGATVRLADVDPHSLNPSVDSLDAVRTRNTKAVILIHYGGAPSDMLAIMAWANVHGITVIEDSACSPASKLAGQACGTFGDFAVWSFDSMKMLSTVEGGAIYVKDRAVMAKLRRDCALGMSTTAGHASVAANRWWEFDVTAPARRSQFNDVSAALGLTQLARLPEMFAKRQAIVNRYNDRLRDHDGLTLPPPEPRSQLDQHSHYFYWIQVADGQRDQLAMHLRQRGIYSSFRYFPLHRTTLFASDALLPGTNHAADTTLNLPCHSLLTVADVNTVADAVLDFFRTA
jgi:dTDP-4-amino-4,6-dideoxygalactose transaminase